MIGQNHEANQRFISEMIHSLLLENHPVSSSPPRNKSLAFLNGGLLQKKHKSLFLNSCRPVQVIAQWRRQGFLPSNQKGRISLNNRCKFVMEKNRDGRSDQWEPKNEDSGGNWNMSQHWE